MCFDIKRETNFFRSSSKFYEKEPWWINLYKLVFYKVLYMYIYYMLYTFFQQNLQACPCVSGYVCNIKTNIYWGQCEAVDGGSGSGAGSDDYWVTSPCMLAWNYALLKSAIT